MDATGAETLRTWIEQQEHWREALSVQRGEQPSTDPDVWELEERRNGTRLYSAREQQRQIVEGRPVLVTQRLTKQLVNGRWETVYEVERTRPA